MADQGLTFTEQNFEKSITGLKWQARRLNSPIQEGDSIYLTEPVTVLALSEDEARVQYHWGKPETLIVAITQHDYELLMERSDWRRTTIAQYMLKSFARHWGVADRVWQEYLQNISEKDAIAEGVGVGFDNLASDSWVHPRIWFDYLDLEESSTTSARQSFSTLWDSINAKSGNGWDTNPIVTCIEYRIGGVRRKSIDDKEMVRERAKENN